MRARGNRRLRVALSVMAMAFGMAITFIGELAGQTGLAGDTLVGRVVRGGSPVANVPVVLHRVTSQTSGEVASSTTGQDGTFRFALEPAEGVAFNVFFVTAEYLSVRYFGHPVEPGEPLEAYAVEVFDTTSTPAAPARVNRRDVVMLPQANDAWEVNEIISILNPGQRAIVADSGLPTLEITMPDGATDLMAGQGDILQYEVSFMENRVLLVTPVLPGRRDLFIRYRIPAQPSSTSFPIEQPTDTFNLYVQQPSHLTSVEGLATTQMIDVEGERFLQYGGVSLPVGAEVAIAWVGGSPVDPVVAAVAVTVALLLAGGWVAVRNRGSPAAV